MLNNQDFAHNRSKCLGGSDIGAVLGLSPYRSAMDVWLEKTGQITQHADSLPLRFGQFAEAFVASEYAQLTQTTVKEPSHAFIHNTHPFLQGHVDRLVYPSSCNDLSTPIKILECKTANPFRQQDWGEVGTDEIPLTYLVQCLWYLMLTDLTQADLAVLFGNHDFRIYTIHRDAPLETLILQQAIHFWEEQVLTHTPPPIRSELDAKKLFQRGCGGQSVEASPELHDLMQALKQHQARITQEESHISHIKEQIMSTLGEAETLTYQGHVIATWKSPKPSYKLDSKRLTQEHPEIAEQYQVPIQNSRRLIIKELA